MLDQLDHLGEELHPLLVLLEPLAPVLERVHVAAD
jgi:hypothetical protein